MKLLSRACIQGGSILVHADIHATTRPRVDATLENAERAVEPAIAFILCRERDAQDDVAARIVKERPPLQGAKNRHIIVRSDETADVR